MWERMLERAVGVIKACLSSPTSRITVSLSVVRSRSTVTVKMKVIETLATVLLAAGIFSLTAARGQFLIRPESSPAELDATSESLDFYVEILNPANYVNFSREQCEENGGSTVYDELEASLQQFQAEVQTLVEPLRHETELALAHPRERIPSVVKKYCRGVPALQEYIKLVTNSIQACMDRAEVQRVIGDRYFANAFLDYICQDGGNSLATFIADGGMECLASKKEELLKYANESFGRYLSGVEFFGDGVSEVEGFEMLFALDTKRCSDVRAFQSSIAGVLADCEEPTTAKVLDDLIDNLIIKLTSCQPSMSFAEAERHFSTTTRDLPSEDEGFKYFMLKKCEKSKGGLLAFNSIGESLKMLSSSSEMLDLKRLVDAIGYAAFASNSDLDVTLALYCRKVPIVTGIVKFITDTVKLCLEPEELGMDILYNVTSSLLEAACYNEGNAIAAFVAGDGVQCVDSKSEELKSCMREIYGGHSVAPVDKRLATRKKQFVIELRDCEDMEKLQICVGQALDECEDKTASYTLDSMFNTILDGMMCEELHKAELRSEWSEAEFLADKARQYLKDNCEKHGGPSAYEAVKEIPEYVASGVALVIMNVEQLQADVTEAQLHGQVDLVSKKYCRKIPVLQKFIKHATESVTPCFRQTPDEQTDIDFQSGMILSFLDFICDNEGERFTKLITFGGLECIRSKRPALNQCIPDEYRGDVEGLVNLREDLNGKGCTAINQTQHCFIDVLNECEDPTAAQTADDLINFLLIKNTNCGPQVNDTE